MKQEHEQDQETATVTQTKRQDTAPYRDSLSAADRLVAIWKTYPIARDV
jgi:hypothetical protein